MKHSHTQRFFFAAAIFHFVGVTIAYALHFSVNFLNQMFDFGINKNKHFDLGFCSEYFEIKWKHTHRSSHKTTHKNSAYIYTEG